MIERDQDYYDNKVDNIIDKVYEIKMHKLTVLTGSNGSGKSVLRQLMTQRVQKDNPKNKVAAISMSLRTGGSGITRAFTSDTPWNSTGQNTYNFVISLFKSSKGRFLVVDEVEIGLAEEMQLSIINYIQNFWTEHKDEYLGLLVITHSRFIVNNLKADEFVNMDGMTKDDWLNREIKPVDFEQFQHDSLMLFRAIDKRIKGK